MLCRAPDVMRARDAELLLVLPRNERLIYLNTIRHETRPAPEISLVLFHFLNLMRLNYTLANLLL